MAPKPKGGAAKVAKGKEAVERPVVEAMEMVPVPPFQPPRLGDEAARGAARVAVRAAAGGLLAELVAALDAAPAAAADALMAAVLGGHAKAARVALLRGADPAAPLPGAPLAPIHVAASQGDRALLRELLAQERLGGARAAGARCAAGRTPLMYAAMHGHRDVAFALLELDGGAACAPEAVDEGGDSAVDYARRCAAHARAHARTTSGWR